MVEATNGKEKEGGNRRKFCSVIKMPSCPLVAELRRAITRAK